MSIQFPQNYTFHPTSALEPRLVTLVAYYPDVIQWNIDNMFQNQGKCIKLDFHDVRETGTLD